MKKYSTFQKSLKIFKKSPKMAEDVHEVQRILKKLFKVWKKVKIFPKK